MTVAQLHRKPTQRQRLLVALRDNPDGVNEVEFAAPNVIDGGDPIQRVAARIWDLKQDGHVIRTVITRNKTATYVLVVDAETAAAGEAADLQRAA